MLTPVCGNHHGKSHYLSVKLRQEPIYQMNAQSEQLNRKKYAALPWSVVLLTANVVGAVIYVVAASHGGWVIPQERAAGVHSVTGEPIV